MAECRHVGRRVPRMTDFETCGLPQRPTAVAPDGSDVRVLLDLTSGSMAHFELGAGRVSVAVTHRTVEELSLIHI